MKKIVLLSALLTAILFQSFAQRIDWETVPYRIGDKWGFSDRSGAVVVNPKYDEVGWFSEGYAPVRIGKRWGYINREAKLVIPAKFTVAKNFRKGFVPRPSKPGGDSILFAGASLRPDKYEICINTKGAVLKGCPAIPENSVPENRIPVKTVTTTKTYSLPNSNGIFDKVIDDYKIAGSDETYYVAVKNNKYGVFNSKFEVVVPFEYTDIKVIRNLSAPYLEVTKNDLVGLINPSGNMIMVPENTRLNIVTAPMGKEYVIFQRGTKYYVRDMANQNVITDGYSNIIFDKEGFIIVDNNNMQGYYFLDNKVITPKYKSIEILPGGRYLKVQTATGMTGYIDLAGVEYFKQ